MDPKTQVAIEKSLGLKKTKVGAGDKEEGYLVGASRVSKVGAFLLVVAVVALVVGLCMRSDLSTQQQIVQKSQVGIKVHKKALFRTKAIDRLTQKQQEAKLIKILSIVQAHFSRDRQEEDMITAFEGRFSVAMDQHKKRINKVLKQLEGNPSVVKYLRTTLYKAAEAFHIHSAAVAKQYGAAVIHQGESSESRLKKFSKSIIKELEAAISAEKLDKEEEDNLEKVDPEWKKMEKKFEKEAHPTSQDEKDVHEMLKNFDSRIKRLPQPVLSKKDIKEAEQLLTVGEKKAMRIDFKHLQETAKTFYKRAGVPIPASATKGNVLKGFRELIKLAKFRLGTEPQIKKQLALWEKGHQSDNELMLKIEQGIKAGQVNPEWLEGDNKDSEHGEAKMMKMGHEDHAEHKRTNIRDEDMAKFEMPGQLRGSSKQQENAEAMAIEDGGQ